MRETSGFRYFRPGRWRRSELQKILMVWVGCHTISRNRVRKGEDASERYESQTRL